MSAKAAVIGIDVGAGDAIAAYVGKGVVDIVQNEVSNRKTCSMVSFTDEQRLLGDQANAQFKSNFKNTCRNFRHLLGRGMSAPDVEVEQFWSTSQLVVSEDNDFVGFQVKYRNQDRVFSAAQIFGMFLTKIKEITEAWCEARVNDVVIAVPAYFTDSHRRAVLDAAEMSGLHVLRLMNEYTATALGYGIYRSNDFDEKTPTTVAFASVGQTTSSVSVVQFVKGQLTVLAECSNRFCGGRDMDLVLMKHFAEEFEKKHKIDPLKNKKSMIKFEEAVTKTKKILSSNNEATISAECVYEDFDLSGKIDRATFEEKCAPLMQKLANLCDETLKKCNVSVEDIDFVEIVGGSSRVPWVQNVLREKFGKELSKTVNADESVARGTALQAAILSPLFKVRDFTIKDHTQHTINIGWLGSSDEDVEKEGDEPVDPNAPVPMDSQKTAPIFPAGSQYGLLKMLTFYRKQPFEIYASYANPEELIKGSETHIGTYRINLPPQPTNKKIKVRAKLTLSGVFEIESAYIYEEEEYEEVTKVRKPITVTSTDEPMPPADAEAEKSADKKDKKKDKKEKKGEEEKKDEADKKEEPKFEWVEQKTMKTRTKKTDVPVDHSRVQKLSPAQMQKRKDTETALQAETRAIREKEEKKNDVEAYIYQMRDKVRGELSEFVTKEDREVFEKALSDAEEWLYDQYDAEMVAFVDKLSELQTLGNPIKTRKDEKYARDQWVPHLRESISNYRLLADSPDPKFDHIAAENRNKIKIKCDETEAWLEGQDAKQQRLNDTEDPFLKAHELKSKSDELYRYCEAILNEPKPAPPPTEEPAPAEEKKEGDAEMGAETTTEADKPEA